MLVVAIAVCEIGFWVLLVAGLAARYLLRRPRLGAVLLVSVPVVDLVLLAVTVLDLGRGGVAGIAHGLAAVYLGFSVAFGHRTVVAMDRWWAHRFAGGPAPVAQARHGPARVRRAWQQWRRAVLGWAVACGLLSASRSACSRTATGPRTCSRGSSP